MKNIKIGILSLSIGLLSISCNSNCSTKITTSDSTTLSGSTATTPVTTTADTNASASAPVNNTVVNSGSEATGNEGSGRKNRTTGMGSGKKDSIDYSNYTKKTNTSAVATPTKVNNPPKGTFGNSVGQDD